MRSVTTPAACVAALLPLDAAAAWSDEKRHYTIFNPTPRALWRPLSPDRPDTTESPVTVDAGAIQVESSVFLYEHDSTNAAGETTDGLALALSTVKVGLLDNADLQLVFAPWVREETEPDGGASDVRQGPSDLLFRLKVNFWGNDEGATALGILPFIKVPTGTSVSNDQVEGGVALPFSWDFADGFSLGLMGQLDVLYREGTGDHELAFLHSAVLGFDIHGPLGGYVEFVGVAFADGEPYEALASFGLTFEVSRDVMLDCGALLGLTPAAPDVAVFTGITVRF
jgi:hypothetical protein